MLAPSEVRPGRRASANEVRGDPPQASFALPGKGDVYGRRATGLWREGEQVLA